uniref:Phospholipid scramblase n=1 Tax=Heliothis virescens TaxID=7102 RepID=A0A2A4J9L6_HELVI
MATSQQMTAAQNTGPASPLVPSVQRLIGLDTVNVHHTRSRCSGNEYTVQADGEVLFTLKEDGHALTFLSKAKTRRIRMDGVDNLGRKVLVLRQPTELFADDDLMLYMDRKLVSVIHREFTFVKALLLMQDANGSPVLRAKSDVTRCDFQLQTLDKREIGKIYKKCSGFLEDIFSNHEYVISFPMDLDVRFKMAAIATCILIEYRYHSG